jgi:hypothetical protein
MVAYTDTVGFDKGSAAHRANSPGVYCVSVDLDFASITAARVAASLTAFATGDSLAVIQIPAKTLIMAAGIDVTTADGTAGTVDLGFTGGDVDAWVDGVDANAVGSAVGLGTLTVTVAGCYLAAADTLDLLMLTAPQDNSVMRIWAVMVDCS